MYKNVVVYPLAENVIIEFEVKFKDLLKSVKTFLKNVCSGIVKDAWIPCSSEVYDPLKSVTSKQKRIPELYLKAVA